MNTTPPRILQLLILLFLLINPVGSVRASVNADTGPSAGVFITPSYVDIGEEAMAFVWLGNVPAEGYTGAEFTCIYDPNFLAVSQISGVELFGWNPITVVNRPQDGKFIAAIAGSNGRKATSSGTALSFLVKGLQAGRTTISCTARVSKGDNILLDIPSKGSTFTVIDSAASPLPFTPTVTPKGPTATPMPDVRYDFVANVCAATWSTELYDLPCLGADWDVKGFILKLDHPVRETGAVETRPGLLTVPPNIPGRFIRGTYPPFKVEKGDHFRTIIGCEGGSEDCYVSFSLDYQTASGPTIENFWSFSELSDGTDYAADLDLSRLIGKEVRFTLTVHSLGPTASNDRALWVAPMIYRTNLSLTPQPPSDSLLTGQVLARKPVTITLYHLNDLIETTITADPDGRFSLTAPAGPYYAVASTSLSLQTYNLAVLSPTDVMNMPTVSLVMGDIDGNDVIDQFDAITIGMNYNNSSPAAADLNNDGIINILDLELLAENYQKQSPIIWQ